MQNTMARILLFGDFHWMVVPAGKQKGQAVSGIAGVVERYINIWKRRNNPGVIKALSFIQTMGHFDYAIGMGDLAECEYNERGIVTSRDVVELLKLKRMLLASLPECNAFLYITGDHELGYRLALSSDSKGGISKNSLENFEDIFGPLFRSIIIDKTHLMLLSSSLINQKVDHRSIQEIEQFEELRANQEEMLINVIDDASDDEKIFLFLHDPDCLLQIDRFLSENQSSKISKVFCGHLHAEFSLEPYNILGRLFGANLSVQAAKAHMYSDQIARWAQGNLERLKLFRKYKLQIVPSFNGMMGIGKGFLILNLDESGAHSIEKFSL